jgi:hypothetical protein
MGRIKEHMNNVNEGRWSNWTPQEIEQAQRQRQINEAWEEEEHNKVNSQIGNSAK